MAVPALSPKFKNAYGQWLSEYEWSHWGTLTTRYELTLKSARRITDGFYKELARAGETRLFWCAEPFDCKEGFHMHCLIKVPEMLTFKNVIDTYQVMSGNKHIEKGAKWNRIELEKFNKGLGACGYVSKYITKELADYDMLTNIRTL